MPGARRVRVVTDSTADLPREWIDRWGIQVVPLRFRLGEETFRDGLDLAPQVFYAQLARAFPTTSQPSVGLLKRVYEQAAAGGGEIVSIHLSSKLSGTCQAAQLAADQVDCRVVVFDSGQISMAVGWFVLAAAQAAREGRSLEEIVSLLEKMKSRVHIIGLIESLEHLRRGGRIGRVEALLGGLLGIRALFTLERGEAVLLERVRTRLAGLRRLVERVAALEPLERAAVVHADAADAAQWVARALAPLLPGPPIPIVAVGQVVASHVGPGAVGVACVRAGEAVRQVEHLRS
ncbi:MAG: DegV family protein [Chloroflexia bacterium]